MFTTRKLAITAALLYALTQPGADRALAQAAQPQTTPPSGQATPPAGQVAEQTPHQPERQKLTFEGDIALWTMAIKPDKTADFEQVMARMREALMKSEDPQRHQQAEGWKVMRLSTPLPDGNIAYVHIVHPVVPGADYTIMQTLYDAFPDERQALYELYRGAFAKNVSLATGSIVVDLAKQP